MIQPLNTTNKDRIKCTVCEKSFGKRYIKTHVEKMHNNSCNFSKNTFDSAVKFKKHEAKSHGHAVTPFIKYSTETKVVLNPKQVLAEEKGTEKLSAKHISNNYMCKQCNVSFKANMELIEHNEKVHIHDNWPDSGSKRDVSMVKTSSVSEPKRKKQAEEDDMIERSRNMDMKIEEKRKREEYEDM